ncbi:MAG TPA: DUF4097 family beta strand repeat-containing protein [Pyrinomonadaceae bacterium]|nr:DUF4097 family beta strand repeat-containing protein [Pyrinomonadaceae bacterium]
MFSGLKPLMIAIPLIGFVMPATRGVAKEYSSVIEQERRVERGSRIVVRNEFGDIRIEGSDRNTVEAVATDLNSSQPVPVRITEASSASKKVFTVSPVESGRGDRQKINILLEVKVPRDVELERIYIRVGNISVSDLDGGVSLRTDDGNISVHRLGSPGGGLIDLATWSGNVDLSNINGDVRIVAISSGITVRCVKGDVAARVSSGEIAVSNIDGDVELNVSSGSASFTGPIHPERRYRLKTLSGNVSMDIPDSVGFTAVLTSYSGQLHTDFQFPSRSKQRIIGKYGDGTGRIELDSFNGSVQLRKIVASNSSDCPR